MSRDPRPPRRADGSNGKTIVAVAAGILLVWFIIANSQQVQVTWWVFDTSTSLIVVILIAALLGAGITYVITRRRHAPSRDRDGADGSGGDGA